MEIQCDCNAMMEIQTPQSVYGEHGTASCRECSDDATGRDYIFHCPNGKNDIHKDGFDLCYNCGARRTAAKNDKNTLNPNKSLMV